MNIERDLRDMQSTHTNRDHQRQLRGALLEHIQEIQTVKTTKSSRFTVRRLVPVGFAFVLAIAIIAGAMFMPRNNKSQPGQSGQGAVARLQGVLTPAQVLAASAEQAEQYKVVAGKYFYQKAKVTNSVYDCAPNHEFSETWTDQNSQELRSRRLNTQGQTIEDHYPNDPGKDYFNQQAITGNTAQTETAQNSCPSRPEITEAEMAKWSAHMTAIAQAYGWSGSGEKPAEAGGMLYMNDLRQGSPKVQAETLRKLQKVGDWVVTNNVTNKNLSNSKLVELSFTYGWAYQRLYFDQQTAAFVGYEVDEPNATYNNYIVVDQRVVDAYDK